MSARARTQLQSDDVAKPETLRRVLNDILLDVFSRVEALEKESGITLLVVELETLSVVSPATRPFFGGGVRIATPFPVTGAGIMKIQQLLPSATAISGNSNTLKWRPVTGNDGSNAIVVDYISGLDISSRYRVHIGVTHG